MVGVIELSRQEWIWDVCVCVFVCAVCGADDLTETGCGVVQVVWVSCLVVNISSP